MTPSPRLLLIKTQVAAYTRADGTFVAAHQDKRVKQNVEPHHVYSMLADADDSGGRAAATAMAKDLHSQNPHLRQSIHEALSDLGHPVPDELKQEKNSAPAADRHEEVEEHDPSAIAPYHRFTSGPSPDNGRGYMMFAENFEKVSGGIYGSNHHTFDPSDISKENSVDSSSDEFSSALRSAIEENREKFDALDIGDDVDQVVADVSPDDIVDTAGLWDDPGFVEFVWENVLEPNGWLAVTTPDGALVFDPGAVKSHGTLKKSQGAPPTRLLLVKAGEFKHSGKYYLLDGRWRKLHADKVVPKGAPIAHSPKSIDAMPFGMLPEQVAQLKLHESNTNASTFNKQLDKIAEYAAAGDATAILGMQYGVNTYSKKLAKVANFLLQNMGVHQHVVAHGQAAGSHSAVQAPAADQEPVKNAEPPAATAQPELAAAEAEPVKEAEPAPAQDPAPAPAALAMPPFQEGKTKAGVQAYYEKVGKKVLDLAAAGDTAGLEQLKADGLKPASKGKPGNTWIGKTPNSKILLALHEKALEHAKGVEPAAQPAPALAAAPAATPAPEPAKAPEPEHASPLTAEQLVNLQSIPWHTLKLPDSNKNAKSHNGKMAKIEAMAFAGDMAGLEAFKAGTNTYGKIQNKTAAAALAALKEGAPVPEPKPVQIYSDATALEAIKAAKQENDDAWLVSMVAKDWLKENPGGEAELSAALVAEGHPGVAADMDLPIPEAEEQEQPAAPAAAIEPSPKDGDTKPAADGGTLVFKDGHWHKQGQPLHPNAKATLDGLATQGAWSSMQVLTESPDTPAAPKAYAQKLLDEHQAAAPAAPTYGALKPSEVIALGKGFKTSPGNKAKIKAFAVAGDGAGLQAFSDALPKSLTQSKKLALKVLEAMGQSQAAPTPAKAPKPAAAPAPEEAPALQSIDGWEQTGGQGGSNPGGRFKDPDGVEWYCKFPANEDIAKSEVLAARLYGAAGVAGQDAKLITKGGKVGIASRWVTVKKAGSPTELAKVQGAQSGFAVDAWLGNWDVVGLSYDNLQVGADGKAVRVDAGGSLEYRAQGAKKPFGPKVNEIDTLRDPKVNAQSAAIFGGMTQADLTASVAKVAGISEPQIRAICEEFGPGDKAARKALADTLIARRADLLARFPKAGKASKKRIDPTKLPVNAAQLPTPHDFANWNGPGQGLSSKPHINAANQSVEQQALDTALQGNLVALKEFKYHGIDKNTGNASAEPVPIAKHPSKHVVQYHADLVQALDEIANPPEPLKVFRETDIGTLAALDAAFPPKPFGTTVASVASNEKMGFWVALGAVKNAAAKLAPKSHSHYSPSAIAAAMQKFKDGTNLARHFIKSVQASGSYNDLFRNGKTSDSSGNKLTDVAQAALEHATEMPEGTTIYRWQTMTDEMLKHVIAAPDGTVFQATGPMCTSYSPTATAKFGKHRVVIRYAKGAKAVESFGSGNPSFAPEKEVTTLPNNRFVILSKKMVPDIEHGNPSGQRLELEILMLPPDLGIPGVKG